MARTATETRSRIVSAARNLFSSHGYSGTSLDDILTVAGITKGAFYHYFKSKEEICLVLLDQAIAATSSLSEPVADEIQQPLDALQRWASQLVNPQEGQLWSHFRLVLRLAGDLPLFNAPIPDKIRRFWTDQVTFLENLICAATSLNPVCGDAHQAALLILSTFAGALQLDQSSLTKLETDQLLETVIKLVMQ